MTRKQEIINGLIEIIVNNEFQTNFTISELAQKVNIGKSTIYEYFQTKDQLLKATLMVLYDKAINDLQKRRIDTNLSFIENFKNELRFLFKLTINGSTVIKFMTADFKTNLPKEWREDFIKKTKNTYTIYEKKLKQLLKLGIDEKVLKPDVDNTKYILAESLISGALAYVKRSMLGIKEPVEINYLIDAIIDGVIKIYQD